MTTPDPTAGEHHPDCYQSTGVPDGLPTGLCDCRVLRMLDAACADCDRPAPPPAVAASTGASEDVEALFDCECGHSLDEHNGLGSYARISYEPLVQCSCALTDDRTHGELLAPRLASLLAATADRVRRETLDDLRRVVGMSGYRFGDRSDHAEALRMIDEAREQGR